MKDEYDLSQGKRGAVVPASGKTRITIWLDPIPSASFRNRAEAEGIGYQTLVNQTLRASLASQALDEATLRRVIREEMKAGNQQAA